MTQADRALAAFKPNAPIFELMNPLGPPPSWGIDDSGRMVLIFGDQSGLTTQVEFGEAGEWKAMTAEQVQGELADWATL
jgi:hypothetical protein